MRLYALENAATGRLVEHGEGAPRLYYNLHHAKIAKATFRGHRIMAVHLLVEGSVDEDR